MPQSARLSAGGGCNRNLGNAQIEVVPFWLGLPLVHVDIFRHFPKFLCFGFSRLSYMCREAVEKVLIEPKGSESDLGDA